MAGKTVLLCLLVALCYEVNGQRPQQPSPTAWMNPFIQWQVDATRNYNDWLQYNGALNYAYNDGVQKYWNTYYANMQNSGMGPNMGYPLPGAQPPAQGGQPPAQGTQPPPNQGTQPPPDQGAQQPPAQGTQQPPAQGTQQPPAQGTQQPPAQGTQQPPAQGTQQPPAQGTQQPPAQDGQQPPAQGTQQPPVPGTQQPPVPGVQTPPTPGAQVPPVPGTTLPNARRRRQVETAPIPNAWDMWWGPWMTSSLSAFNNWQDAAKYNAAYSAAVGESSQLASNDYMQTMLDSGTLGNMGLTTTSLAAINGQAPAAPTDPTAPATGATNVGNDPTAADTAAGTAPGTSYVKAPKYAISQG